MAQTAQEKAIKNGAECAFSIPAIEPGASCEPGLTKREYFAVLALQGFAANPDWAKTINDDWGDYLTRLSKGAVEAADAILLELSK